MPDFKLPREYRVMLGLIVAAFALLFFATRRTSSGETLVAQFARDLSKVALVVLAAFALLRAPWWLAGAAGGAVLRTTLAGSALASLLYSAFGGSGEGEADPCAAAGHGRATSIVEAGGTRVAKCSDGTTITF